MRRAGLILVGLVLALSSVAQAELCAECRKAGPFTKDIGECAECKERRTGSGSFAICGRCARTLNQCERCRKPFAAAVTGPTTRPVDPANDGQYKEGSWEYRLTITLRGTRSEGSTGELLYEGRPVADAEAVNDFHRTPWGPMYWVGRRPVPFGAHGWSTKPWPATKVGKELPAPTGGKADITQPGTYRQGPWEYRLVVTSPGTKSEGTLGTLLFNGKPLDEPAVGDYYRTPWGEVQWVGNPSRLWGEHGWVLRDTLVAGGRALEEPPADTKP